MVTKDHLKLVLTGAKKFLKMSAVRFCNPPAFDEIGVKALYQKIVAQPDMADYFPSKFPKGRQCCRSYMYNIWNTVHPEDVQAVFQHANSVRYSITSEKIKQETIAITDEWKQELDAMPFVSKVKGKMSALLKQKSKINVVHQPRKTYEAFDFGKKARDEELRAHQEARARLATEDTIMTTEGRKKIVPKVVPKVDKAKGE